MANEQKQKNYICHEWFKIKQFFAHKNKLIWIAKLNYQRIANFTNSKRQIKNIIFYQYCQNANKSKFKSGKIKVNLPIVFLVLNAQNCTKTLSNHS
jgi:hypothetical protein